MALIGKIRKNYWLILIVLGLALAAFIMMDMTGAGGPQGASSLTMGSVAGEKIDYKEFQRTESSYYANAQGDVFSKRKSIWDYFVERALLRKEAGALGLNVSKDELMDLQFGAKQSPIITQNWRNPQTGQIDQATLQSFKTTLEAGDDLNPQFRSYWAEQENQIVKQSLQDKLNALVSKSVYTPTWMAEESFKLDNTKVDFNYVKIPFDQIDGAGMTVTDAEIMGFANSKKDKYTVDQETRVIDYIVFDVLPSETDKASIMEKLQGLKTEYINSTEDSLFTVSNNGSFSHLYASSDQLPEIARTEISSLNAGEVYGPFEQEGYAMIIKMIDKRNIPDSVEARHILKSVTAGNVAGLAAAYSTIDSIKRAYRAGASWEDLALNNSDDTSNNATGGSLGKFTQTSMVPEFATAAFTGNTGGLYTVKTQFGVHLLEVQDQVFGNDPQKYRIASIAQPIIPSQETQDQVFDQASDILTANKDMVSLSAAVANLPNVSVEQSRPLMANDHAIGNLESTQTSRDIIQAAFSTSTKVGKVSPEVFRYTDKVNYYENKYVLMALNSIVPKGIPTASSLRSQIETLVLNNKKAKAFASGLSVTSLQDVASQNGVQMQTARDVGSKSITVTGIGKEPSVLAAAFGIGVQAVSQPIVGETGVFVVQPISRQDAGAPTNLPTLKTGLSRTTKSQVDFNLIKNMKKRADIKDDRSTFF